MASGSGFFEQFIDDYFAECDEHLAVVRRILLRLEQTRTISADELQDLARALHTVKGLSGMVGLEPAEQVAHAMEDAADTLSAGATAPAESIELLFAGAALLEDRIEARRQRRAPEPADDYLAHVRRVIMPAVAADAASTPAAVVAAPAGGARTMRVGFTPASELAQRGVTIETIRARIATVGEIVSGVPKVHPGGGVYFEFTVRMHPGAALDDAWREDGMTWSADAISDVPAEVVQFEPPEAARPARPMAGAPANLVRVDLTRLDESMRVVGELVVSRNRLQDAIDRVAAQVGDAALEPVVAAADAIERQLRTLREGIVRIRLVPIGEVFERMRFAMRDIAREHGKIIDFDFEGGDTELDKVVIDRIVEPLMHLVRNAASHGIEPPAHREAVGKAAAGHIVLRARAAGDRIIVEVEDDGGGINVERVEARAHARGLLPARATLEPSAVLDMIAAPGFSTTESADMASGRGVGMAVVLSSIRGLGGELTLDSRPGEGTLFRIELPLTLMITDALLIEVGGETMAVPQILLREILPLAEHPVTTLENNQVITYRESVLPLIDLRTVFRARHQPPAQHVLVVGSEGSLQGLIVDRVRDLREIVVQPVADPYVSVVGVAGATELADGRVSLILDVPAILRQQRRPARARALAEPAARQALGSGQ